MGDEKAEQPANAVDHDKVRRGATLLLEGLGLKLSGSLEQTPERVATMYAELFTGLHVDPGSVLDVSFDEEYDELVLLKGLPLYSVCEHHLLPFIGRAHVGYIPSREGKITGLSKLARVVEILSRRPTVQERLTMEIANVIDRSLSPRGVIVVIEAEHLCMTMRGVQKPGTTTVTSAVRGSIRTDPRTRAEALALIR